MPELLDGIIEDIDWIETLVGIDRPSLRFIYLDKREEHVKPIALLASLRRAPAGIDLDERGAMIVIGADWADLHRMFPARIATPSKHRCGRTRHACR